jgi:hypothetical protein
MRNKNLWLSLSFLNLCIVALLGVTLRTKFLFPVPWLDYRNFLSAHSHFAFGGWISLSLMFLYMENLLPTEAKQSKFYQWTLWGINITSLGMAVSFPFKGYAFFSILFSTAFIFVTYAFSWKFIKDLNKVKLPQPVKLLSLSAIACLVFSSAGPFYLARMMATHTGNAFQYRDAVYGYMHFQYNGFFTFSVLALFFNHVMKKVPALISKVKYFSIALVSAIVPTLFASLLWHSDNSVVRLLAAIGAGQILIILFLFFRFAFKRSVYSSFEIPFARVLSIFVVLSFTMKMLLQFLIVFKDIGHIVFGYRPIIIGFLHLVFLAFVTFYIFSNHIERRNLSADKKNSFARFALIFLCSAIFFNETVLLFQGFGIFLETSHPIFPWLLWIASLCLLSGAILVLIAFLRQNKRALYYNALAEQ